MQSLEIMVGRRGEARLVPPYTLPSVKKALALGVTARQRVPDTSKLLTSPHEHVSESTECAPFVFMATATSCGEDSSRQTGEGE